MWCRRCAHSSTIWDTTYRAAGVTLSTSGWFRRSINWRKNAMSPWPCRCMRRTSELRNDNSWAHTIGNIRIGELLEACWHLHRQAKTGRSVNLRVASCSTGVNEQTRARRAQLARLLKGRPTAKLNLIPFNAFPGTRYRRSSCSGHLGSFADILNDQSASSPRSADAGGRHRCGGAGNWPGRVTDRTLGAARHQTDSTSRRPGGNSMSSSVVKILGGGSRRLRGGLLARFAVQKSYRPAVMAATNMQLAIEYLKTRQTRVGAEIQWSARSQRRPGEPGRANDRGPGSTNGSMIFRRPSAPIPTATARKERSEHSKLLRRILVPYRKAVAGEKLFAAGREQSALSNSGSGADQRRGLRCAAPAIWSTAERYFTRSAGDPFRICPRPCCSSGTSHSIAATPHRRARS